MHAALTAFVLVSLGYTTFMHTSDFPTFFIVPDKMDHGIIMLDAWYFGTWGLGLGERAEEIGSSKSTKGYQSFDNNN